MKKSNFIVYHDDTQNDVIEKISDELEKFGLEIVWIEAVNEGFDEYEIISKI
jgi:hypothetical protein